MPRVGFFQSVLRQPTRSYANPHAASPWALDDEDDNASGSSRGYGYSRAGNTRGDGYQYASGSSRYGPDDRYNDSGQYGTARAGPSRQGGHYRPPPQAFAGLRANEQVEEDDYDLDRAQSVRNRSMSESGAKARKPRKAKSTIGVSPVEEEYAPAALTEERLATRFPRAAPKSRSVVGIQNTGRGVAVVEHSMGANDIAGQQAVKRKKKRPPVTGTDVSFPVSASGEGRMSEAARMAADTRARTVSGPSAFSVTTIKSARIPTSSVVNSPVPKTPKPPGAAASLIPAQPVAPPTRPASLVQRPSVIRQAPHAPASASSSSAQSSRDPAPQTPPDPPMQQMPMELPADDEVTIRPKDDNLRRSDSTRTARSARSRMSVASTATGDTVYYTPPTSPGSDKFVDSSDEEGEGEAAPEIVVVPQSEQGDGGNEDLHDDPETPAAEENGPPRLTVQPPTPAPEPDTSESIFHTPVLPSPSPASATQESQASSVATGVPKRALSITRPRLAPTGSAPPVMAAHDDDARSLHAHTGSDDEDQPTSPTSPDAEAMSAHQLSRPPARPPSITHSAPLPPRKASRSPGSRTHSRQTSRAGSTTGSPRPPSSYAYAASDVSASALAAGVHKALRRPSREGSIRSSSSFSAAAGFGKGGWAAAAASGSQSGRNSPVPQPAMYMPTGTMDGWEQFHVPPPPRQTKYTPLPAASQPASFERLLSADQPDSRGGSVRSGGSSPRDGSVDGRAPNGGAAAMSLGVPLQPSAGVSESSASQYSREEENEEDGSSSDEDVERPSRSYTVVDNPLRLPPAGPEEHRRPSMDPSAPPIPAKSPRRFSMDEPDHSQPFGAIQVESSGTLQPSESQYSYGSESAQDSPPDPPSTGRLPDAQSLKAPQSAQPPVMDPYDDGQQYSDASSDEYEGEDPDDIPARPLSPAGSIGSTRFPRPAFLNPDVLTILPEMSVEDSDNLYRSPVEANGRQSWRGQSRDGDGSVNDFNPYDDTSRPGSRAASRAGSIRRSASAIGALETGDQDSGKKRPISILRPSGKGKGSSNGGSEVGSVQGNGVRKAKSSIGFSLSGKKEEKKSVHWEGSSMGEGVLMLSDGKEERVGNGYTSLILPAGAYTPTDPSRKRSSLIDHRVLGMPSTVMAALTLSGSASKLHQTPAHLRHNLPPPVDFSSHLAPPNKVGSAQVLVQIYAVGVDKIDTRALEEKGKGEVGKWVPGRSFVGRVIAVGKDEREVVKGELVLGLLDVRKSGALAEYMLVDRRRVTRAPHPTSLTLEQLSLLPLHGLPAVRTIRSLCLAPRMTGDRALIQDAHQGVPALLCQELSRRGVHVTAIISGGENAHEAQTKCMAHGARGVLTGSPAAVMFGLEEGGWEWVVDTTGGERVYDACKRVLRENGKLISLVKAASKLPAAAQAASKPSGFRTLRAAFAPKATRRDSKHIHFEYVPPAGDGEPEVDARGMDVRDVLEDDLIKMLRPSWEGERVWNFERGWEAFKVDKGLGVSVVRLIN